MAFASAQKREGKTDLAEFICNRGSKAVDDCLAVAMELASAEEKYSRSQKNRLELLQESNDSECVEGCGGKWIQAALDLLAKNEIDVAVFSTAIYTLLEQGRGKFRNIFLHGVANCGKTFLLSPLATIYNTFSNPATGTFAWVGVEDCEIIWLNDFRWSQSIIAWADMLRLLEGDVVHLPCPKKFCKRDIELRKDTPVFATSDAPIVFKSKDLNNVSFIVIKAVNLILNSVCSKRLILRSRSLSLDDCLHSPRHAVNGFIYNIRV